MVKPRPTGAPQDLKSLERAAADRAPAPDDALMFRAAVGDVKPLAPTGRASERAMPEPKPRARRGAAAPMPTDPAQEPASFAGSAAPEDVVGGTEPLSFRRPGVRDQVMRRLRRGLYPIEDELDLHGLNQAAARDSLREFLESNRAARHRCVRIVHGKGHRSGSRGPILKIAVNGWLRRHPEVMAFSSARAIDGGTGALYVLLRA